VKIETAKLEGIALDWAVAKCEGVNSEAFRLYYNPTEPSDYDKHGYLEFHYSSIWAQGGPIIDQEDIDVVRWANDSIPERRWMAKQNGEESFGTTPLIAAMRCYVASKLGDVVEVPDELQ
jgi:Protein of unknown function (DUF2591)